MKEVFIEEDKNILNAMRQFDKSVREILFVHNEGKLLASLTDGNIRRWILKKGDLQVPIKYADN